MNKQLLAPLAASLLCMTANAQAPAFPGAEGHGRYVTGGRGGEIIHTTGIEETLADGNSSHSAIAHVEYFSLNGTKLATPTKGVNIRQTTLANGKVVTDKVIK